MRWFRYPLWRPVLVASGISVVPALLLTLGAARGTGTSRSSARRPATAATRAPEPPVATPEPATVVAPTAATTVSSLLAAAAAARHAGDPRRTLALLEEAVTLAPGVETHAALGALYLDLGAVRRAEANLRAAAEGDPENPDRWVALANALAAKPDPMAAATALARAREVEPDLRVTRDPGGRLVRAPTSPPS